MASEWSGGRGWGASPKPAVGDRLRPTPCSPSFPWSPELGLRSAHRPVLPAERGPLPLCAPGPGVRRAGPGLAHAGGQAAGEEKGKQTRGPHQLSECFLLRHGVPPISSRLGAGASLPPRPVFGASVLCLGATVLGVCCRARGPGLPDKPGAPSLLWGSGLSTGAFLNLGLLPRPGRGCGGQ